MRRRISHWMLAGFALALLLGGTAAVAQPATAANTAPAAAPPAHVVPDLPAASQARPFDADKATEAYLARLAPEQRAKSDAYFVGGYWITLWSFLYGLGVAWILLATRLSARMRDLAERWTRFRPMQTFLSTLSSTSWRPSCSAFHGPSTRTSSASTSTAWRRRISRPGWPTSSRAWGWG